jgi:hypothetical protein
MKEAYSALKNQGINRNTNAGNLDYTKNGFIAP